MAKKFRRKKVNCRSRSARAKIARDASTLLTGEGTGNKPPK